MQQMRSRVPESFESQIVLVAACALGTAGVMIFAMLPLLLGTAADAMSLDDAQLGLLASVYIGGYTIIAALSFFWITRIDWRRAFRIGVFCLTSGLLAAAALTTYQGVMIGLAIAGLGAGFMHALSVAIIAEMNDADRKFGIKMIPEQAISAVLLFLLPTLVIARWGLIGMLIALCGFFLLTLPLASKIPGRGRKQEAIDYDVDQATIKPPMVFAALLGLLLFFGGIAGIWAFMERFASEGAIDATVAGQLLAVGMISSAVGPMIPALIGDRYGRVTPLFTAGSVVLLSLLILVTPISLWKYGLVLIILPAAWYAGMAYQMGVIAEADVTGRYSVLMTAALGIGATLGPATLGIVKSSFGLAPALAIAGVTSIAGIVVSIVIIYRLEGVKTQSANA